jgi:hypothetical protein
MIPHKNCIENKDGSEEDSDSSLSWRRRLAKMLKQNTKMTNAQETLIFISFLKWSLYKY